MRWWRPCGAIRWAGSSIGAAPCPTPAYRDSSGGFAGERVLRAPADGILHQLADIGVTVAEGDVVATVEGQPMRCTISGVLRGILPEGTPVFRGMKAGDVDPRGKREYCDTVSDKALAVGGGVLEAVLALSGKLKEEP